MIAETLRVLHAYHVWLKAAILIGKNGAVTKSETELDLLFAHNVSLSSNFSLLVIIPSLFILYIIIHSD